MTGDSPFKDIDKIYNAQTTTVSKICRGIVFALIGAIWVFFQKNGIFQFNHVSTLGLALLSVYVLFDVLQYFIISLLYGLLYFFRERLSNISAKRNRIDALSFILFSIKIIYLIAIIVVFAVYIFTVLYES